MPPPTIIIRKDMSLYTENDSVFLIGQYVINGRLYGLGLDGNTVFSLNENTNELVFDHMIFDSQPVADKSYHFVSVVGQKCYFVPFMGNALGIYDYEVRKYKYIKLDLSDEYLQPNVGKFYNIVLYENKIVLIPFGYKAIMIYDSEKEKWKMAADMRSEYDDTRKILFSRYTYYDLETIILPSLSSNSLFFFNLRNETITKKTILNKDICFSAIEKYDDDYWIVAKNKLLIIRWNEKKKILEKYTSFPDGCEEDNRHCFDDKGITLYKNWLYCFPAGSNMAIRMDLNTKVIEQLHEFDEFCCDKRLVRGVSTFDGCARNDEVVYLHYQLGEILRYNMESREIKKYSRRISLSGWLELMKNSIQKEKL